MADVEKRMRDWRGPALFSYGFRPFFLAAGVWAVLGMCLWLAMLSGQIEPSGPFDQISWHAHEFLFGYTSAVIAGFVLTAVPNWTGRLPVTGWPLACLIGLWLLGRLSVLSPLDWRMVLCIDLSMLVGLVGMILREIVAGRNWRNLAVAALVTLFGLANALFHIEAARGLVAANGLGLRMGLAAVLMLIALIGGRIIPSFTRNWLAARGAQARPIPFGRGDAGVLALTAVTLLAFVAFPAHLVTSSLCVLTGIAHIWRLSRWRGLATGPEPLVWVLHLAYAMLALGFLTEGAAGFGLLPGPAARHVWLAGGIGLMTLAVMSRASLGHTGRPLHAGLALSACYLALALSVVTRLAAGIWPGLLHLSATLWILAFAGYVILYWPILTGPRLARKTASQGTGVPKDSQSP